MTGRLIGAAVLAAALAGIGCASDSGTAPTATPAERTEQAMVEAFESGALTCAAIEADPTPEAMARVTTRALNLPAEDIDPLTVGRVYRNECQ